ncbi:MAG TPA: peptidylprolyl isomerase, partial [Bryobacteraceae bacterium]|nr:peptidylprolyl isomerase [Bryobacteraceae bacterium]
MSVLLRGLAYLLPICALAQSAPDVFRVKFDTTKGSFILESHRDWSPHGVDRFYELIRAGYFDNSRFHRTVPNYVVQFGIAGVPAVAQKWRDRKIADDPVRESNMRGTVGFAMTGPNTRTTQIYINLKDNMQLDVQGFSPIAMVVEGMDVVDKLYSGYGETSGGGMRAGKQQKLFDEGNAYLDRAFPKLDKLVRATVTSSARNEGALDEKSDYFYRDLLDKHFEDGLYVSIVPVLQPGEKHTHSTNESGNVIHAGVWTGRYLGGVGMRYAVTKDPAVRKHGGDVLAGLRRLQEVTGKPGLLARGYIRGNGPVEGWERDGRDSTKWHQGQGDFAGYRWYSDVSVDNFNAVLYGYAIYYDLAADETQKKIIAHDVDRLMTHVLDNHCRIIDVDGKVTQYGHIGMDPSMARDDYYRQLNAALLRRNNIDPATWRPPLRSSLMLLPDLLIAYRVTGKERYRDFYRQVIARFKDNPDRLRDSRPFSLERVARVNHSSEGQAYEALYNLIRYEKDPEL